MARISISVSLTPHLDEFIAAEVNSGRYQSVSEVVRAALRLLEAQAAQHPAKAAKSGRLAPAE